MTTRLPVSQGRTGSKSDDQSRGCRDLGSGLTIPPATQPKEGQAVRWALASSSAGVGCGGALWPSCCGPPPLRAALLQAGRASSRIRGPHGYWPLCNYPRLLKTQSQTVCGQFSKVEKNRAANYKTNTRDKHTGAFSPVRPDSRASGSPAPASRGPSFQQPRGRAHSNF